MGIEPLFLALWWAQVGAAGALALKSAISDRWFAAMGAIFGLTLGFLPLFVFQGPAVWKPWELIALLSTVGLSVLYGAAMRWKRFALVTLLLTLPVGFHTIARTIFLTTLNSPLLTPVALLGELATLLGPIICALAIRELFGRLDDLFVFRRSA
jgi:hypothetical protein